MTHLYIVCDIAQDNTALSTQEVVGLIRYVLHGLQSDPSSDQPHKRLQIRTNLDGSKYLFEAEFDVDNYARDAVALVEEWVRTYVTQDEQLVAFYTQEAQTALTNKRLLTKTNTTLNSVIIHMCASDDIQDWTQVTREQSRQTVLEYLRANRVEWESDDLI